MNQLAQPNLTHGTFKEYSSVCEQASQLSPNTVELLRQSNVIQMLQPKAYGGLETSPDEFMKQVIDIARQCPAAGWIAGVVGVHPWEAAFSSKALLEELWGAEPDNWIASPYAPMGYAEPKQGGYELSGRWTFSSGCNHASWYVLGARSKNQFGEDTTLHVMLPKDDVKIIDSSWQVDALQGTGSKDIVVDGAFIAEHRVVAFADFFDGKALAASSQQAALYKMPWSAIFPSAITSAVLGICQGMIDRVTEFVKSKAEKAGTADVLMIRELAVASRVVAQSQDKLLANVAQMFEQVSTSVEISLEQRVNARTDQVLVAHQAVNAINQLFSQCGGSALQSQHNILRFWRDANAGLTHATFTKPNVLEAQGALLIGTLTDEQISRALI